jgi:hypothetical protein
MNIDMNKLKHFAEEFVLNEVLPEGIIFHRWEHQFKFIKQPDPPHYAYGYDVPEVNMNHSWATILDVEVKESRYYETEDDDIFQVSVFFTLKTAQGHLEDKKVYHHGERDSNHYIDVLVYFDGDKFNVENRNDFRTASGVIRAIRRLGDHPEWIDDIEYTGLNPL